jgi:sulfofructose kinase
MPSYDVCGLGLNATDTLVLVPRMPPYAGKIAFQQEMLSPGGQVATAMVACAKLGLRTKYVGSIGDDERSDIQVESLKHTGIDLSDLIRRKNCPNQTAYIIIDRSTGERTVFWNRDERLRIRPEEIQSQMIADTRLLHVDGADTEAVVAATQLAKQMGIPVTADVDTIYHGFEKVLPNIDYLIASSEFPSAWTNESDPCKALERIQTEYGIRVAAMTLGAHGALARWQGKFYYSAAYIVNTVDTTGAGDVFHGAFCYGILQDWPLNEILDVANSLAALNCTAIGARGGIANLSEAKALMQRAERRVWEGATKVSARLI